MTGAGPPHSPGEADRRGDAGHGDQIDRVRISSAVATRAARAGCLRAKFVRSHAGPARGRPAGQPAGTGFVLQTTLERHQRSHTEPPLARLRLGAATHHNFLNHRQRPREADLRGAG